MSLPFLYVEFKVTPKGRLACVTGGGRVAIQLPFDQVADWKLRQPDRYLTDEEIAVELTQEVAIGAADRFVALTHRPIKEREIHSARFLPQGLFVMSERDCDYEDNGVRAWFIA